MPAQSRSLQSANPSPSLSIPSVQSSAGGISWQEPFLPFPTHWQFGSAPQVPLSGISAQVSVVRNFGTGKRIASIIPFITDFSRLAGIAGGRAVIHCIAELGTGTEQTVIRTVGIVGRIDTGVIHFVAGIVCTANAIITGKRYSSLADTGTVTGLVTVAVQSVGTGGGCRRVRAVCLAAAGGCAVCCAIVAVLACIYCSVTTYSRLVTAIGRFIADVSSTTWIARRRTIISLITELCAITE
jgi:hypothetical protein